MAINFGTKKVNGFDKELLLYKEGYIGKPVTVSKTTISGLTANDAGKYIIPQGTLITGTNGSLLEQPLQEAIKATVTQTLATVTVNTVFKVTAKEAGDLAYAIQIVKGANNTLAASIAYTPSTTKFVVTLATDKTGVITSTYGDVVALFNNDLIANTMVIAELVSAAGETTLAAVTATDAVTAGGAAEVVTGTIDGILLHSVDVTDGEATGAMVIAGVVNMDNMPVEPSTAVKAALPKIIFSRID